MSRSGKIYSFDKVFYTKKEPAFSMHGIEMLQIEHEGIFIGRLKKGEYVFVVDGKVLIEKYIYSITCIEEREDTNFKKNWIKQKLMTPDLPEIDKTYCNTKRDGAEEWVNISTMRGKNTCL